MELQFPKEQSLLFQSVCSTIALSTGRTLKCLIQTGWLDLELYNLLPCIKADIVEFIRFRISFKHAGSHLKKKLRDLNFATCHLVLVHAAVLGWGLLYWRPRLPLLRFSGSILLSELLRQKYAVLLFNCQVYINVDVIRYLWSLVLELQWDQRMAFISKPFIVLTESTVLLHNT